MTAITHALTGTVIAVKIGNPALAIPLAFVSHLVADSIPHWDVATHRHKKRMRTVVFHLFVDVSLSFIISFLILSLLFPKISLSYAFLIIMAAQILDWITGPYYLIEHLFNRHPPPFNWFYIFQKKFDRTLDKPWGIVTQIGFIIPILILSII